MRRIVQLGFVLLVACSSTPRSAPAPRDTGPVRTWTPGPLSTDGDYPPQYPVLNDAELERRTRAAEAAAPGWRVIVDSLGFLYRATCADACPSLGESALSPADQKHVEEFISKNDTILAANASGVVMKTPNERMLNYVQTGPYGAVTTIHVGRDNNGLTISYHVWPRLPTAEPKSDAEIDRALRRLDADPELVVRRGYRTTSDAPNGPVQLRLAACLARPSEDGMQTHQRPRHPCVDGHSGEDITSRLSNTYVGVQNGVANKRRLIHPFKD